MTLSPDDSSASATDSASAGDEATIPEASLAVRREWLRRIEAEYTSSARTAELGLWLIRLGAPRELIDDALRIVADELDHAELSAAVCEAAGESARPRLRQEQLTLSVSGDGLAECCLHACLEVFCLGETLAVPLFAELRRLCTVEVARRALDRILSDEVRHRQFGWDLLDYLFDVHPSLRDVARAHLPTALARIKNRYGRAELADEANFVCDADRAWGLMAPGLYREILQETWHKEYQPRFADLGVAIDSW